MISCKKATELVSKAMEENLSIREKLSLRYHLYICEACDQFRKQLRLFRKVFSGKAGESASTEVLPELSQASKEALKSTLNKISNPMKK